MKKVNCKSLELLNLPNETLILIILINKKKYFQELKIRNFNIYR